MPTLPSHVIPRTAVHAFVISLAPKIPTRFQPLFPFFFYLVQNLLPIRCLMLSVKATGSSYVASAIRCSQNPNHFFVYMTLSSFNPLTLYCFLHQSTSCSPHPPQFFPHNSKWLSHPPPESFRNASDSYTYTAHSVPSGTFSGSAEILSKRC